MSLLDNKFIDIHSHHISYDDSIIQIINIYPEPFLEKNDKKFYSMGMHPWFIENNYNEKLDILGNNLHYSPILAIGECGLDKNCKTPFKTQLSVFEKQIMFAHQAKKPLIIHCVKAYEELLALTKGMNMNCIIHGFSGSINLAEQLISKGFFISIGANVFTNLKIQNVIKQIPLDSVFLESDNKPNIIKSVYSKVCELQNIELMLLQNKIKSNFDKIWKIG